MRAVASKSVTASSRADHAASRGRAPADGVCAPHGQRPRARRGSADQMPQGKRDGFGLSPDRYGVPDRLDIGLFDLDVGAHPDHTRTIDRRCTGRASAGCRSAWMVSLPPCRPVHGDPPARPQRPGGHDAGAPLMSPE